MPYINKGEIPGVSTGTATYCRYIKRRIANNKNFLGVITGPTGSGKSYSALKLMEILNPDKTPEELIKNVAFNQTEFMHRINSGELYNGVALIWEETGVGLSSRDWQKKANKSILYLLQTFRNMNLIVIFTLPYFSFLDVSARKLMHSLIQTVKIDTRNKFVVLKPFVLHTDQHTGKIYNPYLKFRTKSGDIVPIRRISMGLPSKKLLELYEERKTGFTKQLNIDIGKGLETATRKETGEIDNLTAKQRLYTADSDEGLNQQQIAKKRNTTQQGVSSTLRSARLRGWVPKN